MADKSDIIRGNMQGVLKRQTAWEQLWFYRKAVVLYQMTYVFVSRFLPKYGDRTVDQMIQAARSGKQNIVEGSADGMTSTEMELKLLNVARASIKELREDYEDFIISRRLERWTQGHERYDSLLKFCRDHNNLADYEPFLNRWTAEEMANTALTLCHMIDKMMISYQKKKEKEFVTEGGIRERMTAARLGYRNMQKEKIAAQQNEIAGQKNKIAVQQNEIAAQQKEITGLKDEIVSLKKEIAALKRLLNERGNG